MSATDDKPRFAKVRAGQELLFPQSARQLSDTIGLKWWVTLKLHADGWLSFDPEKASALNEPQEHELRFVGSLVTGGCDDAMLARLLAGLEKPYCYRPDSVYYDWASQSWRPLPTPPEEPDPDQVLDDWLSALAEDDDLATLQDIQERVAATIAALPKKSPGEQKSPP